MKYFAFALAIALAHCTGRADSQTFTALVDFTGTGGTASGAAPYGSLTLDGTALYGMTADGGDNGIGNIFSVGMDGTNYQNLVSFTGTGGTANGKNPVSSLTLSGTTLFGMTINGGNAIGNVFSVGTDGQNYKNLVSFTGNSGTASGGAPYGSVTLSGTKVYGMTQGGGANGYGNVFIVGTDGRSYNNIVSFTGTGGSAAGGYPLLNSLTLSGTTLYGMTNGRGAFGSGNIFSVGTGGTNYRNLVSFTGTGGSANGSSPFGSLTVSGTKLYGMTGGGGANGVGSIFSVGTSGTNYQNVISFTGTAGTAIGAEPFGSLTRSGTTLYGMTADGGIYAEGNIFSVGIDGSNFQDLYDFTHGTDGGDPRGDLILSSGTLFGMTLGGGDLSLNDGGGYGTIFALTLPTPTPEPGTLALVGSAAAVIGAYRWRKRRLRWRAEGGDWRAKAACRMSEGGDRRP